uniref:Long-chain-fatty-acid--CoA ligase n=1 Tax=uncultured bacterium esnapd13 TaxID=1366593 RepID=S5TUL3_9BACT|nr:long-chain-fatty-acid--CoA ligase [uncultured bacterium esnapd13]
MDLASALRWTAERYPHRRAVGGPRPMTYRQWDDHTDRLAGALAARGVRPGDRVAMLLAGGEPLASLHFAVQKLGAASVPLSTRYSRDEVAYCLVDSAPALLVTDEITDDAVGEIPESTTLVPLGALVPEQPAPPHCPAYSDISVMLYTSGTTGRPKGVPRTHAAEHAAAVAHLIQTQHRQGEVTLGVMPMFHTMGMRSLLASVVAAGTWVPQVRFDAEESLELITAEGVGALYLVPTAYWSLLHTGRFAEAKSVRRLAYAGASMTPALAERLDAELSPDVFVNHFGSTEIYTFSIGPDVRVKPGCAGRAGVFSRVRLIDPNEGASPEDVVSQGEQGQVTVSLDSPEAFAGYWNRPDADAKSIRDGWYLTGDLATEDADGDLWVAGRVDDMINSGGENIFPEDIEDVLVRCDAIDEVVVVGLPDDRWGSAVTAFVVPRPGLPAADALAELEGHARDGLPSLKRPKRYLAVPAIPKSAVGKILRRELVAGHYDALAER